MPSDSIGDLLESAIDLDYAGAVSEPIVAALTLMKAMSQLDAEKWRVLQSRQPKLIPGLFQICAKAIGQPLKDLKLIVGESHRWKYLSHDSCKVDWNGAGSITPKVKDPDWFLEKIVE